MNRHALLHMVERFEGLVVKLPGAIQRAVLHELTPLKQLFLQQRPPRLLLAGADHLPLPQVINLLFHGENDQSARHLLFEVYRWQTLDLRGATAIAVLDARGADATAEKIIRAELDREPADLILMVSDEGDDRTRTKQAESNGNSCIRWNDEVQRTAGLVTIRFTERTASHRPVDTKPAKNLPLVGRRWGDFAFGGSIADKEVADRFVRLLAERLPNTCRVELVRTAGDRQAQHDIAQVLIKSCTAICAAVGAQPIPLADLPVLTTLQALMISGVMYVSGRERNLRAATEFLGAIGANVGAGMLMREGARALLKFIPGWGNVVCGAIAGAGTYAVGKAATGYFIEGVSLQDARRTYLSSRRRRAARTGRAPLLPDEKAHIRSDS